MASSSYNPLATAPEPLKPSGGGRSLGGAQPLVAHADEDAEEDIVDTTGLTPHQDVDVLFTTQGRGPMVLRFNECPDKGRSGDVNTIIATVRYPFQVGSTKTSPPAWVTAGQAVFKGHLVATMCIANVMDAYLSLDEPTAIPRAINPQMNKYTYKHGRDVKSSWKVVPAFKNQ